MEYHTITKYKKVNILILNNLELLQQEMQQNKIYSKENF